MFKKATKKQSKARIALIGPSGSGKTFTALRLAHSLAEGGEIAVFDTERGSASKYVGDENPDGGVFSFDVMDDMKNFDANLYIKAINEAANAGYKVLIIDSLSHAWAGTGGILDYKDAVATASKSGSTFDAWKKATPLYNKLIDAILRAPIHIVATMRSKTEYVIEREERNGKTVSVPRKVGMQPIQRDGLEYEFDVIIDTDGSTSTITKSRCSALKGSFHEAGADIGDILRAWLSDGAPQKAPEEDENWPVEQEAFLAELAEIGTDYASVADLCDRLDKPRPAYMTTDKRKTLLEWLKSPKGKLSLEAACD